MRDGEAALGTLTVALKQAAPIPLDAAFSCGPNELLSLVGPSGSGKTTILRGIAGLMRPAEGRIACGEAVWLDTQAGTQATPQERRCGLVFQDYALFPHMTALETVALAVPSPLADDRLAKARALLARVNLAGLEERRPAALSGGQQQRVALARALAREPRVLLLDEPFSAVDQMTRERLKRELADLRGSLGCPVVLVTHDLSEALALSDRIGVLSRGRLLQIGATEDVRLRPASPAVARLMGETNIQSGTIEAAARDGQPGRLAWAGHTLELADTRGFPVGATVAWMIPAEAIVLHRRGRPSQGERENPIAATVRAVTHLGADTAVTVSFAGAETQTLNFSLPTHAARRNELQRGAEVTVSLLADSLHVFDAVS